MLHRSDLGPGSFGENLTVEGMSESDVAIGDEFEIGSARFVVTQPRLPCYKLAFALNTPTIGKDLHEEWPLDGFPRASLQWSERSNPGDEIHPLPSREKERVTIAEFLAVFKSGEATPDQLRRILSLQALPDDWKDSFERKIEVSG